MEGSRTMEINRRNFLALSTAALTTAAIPIAEAVEKPVISEILPSHKVYPVYYRYIRERALRMQMTRFHQRSDTDTLDSRLPNSFYQAMAMRELQYQAFKKNIRLDIRHEHLHLVPQAVIAMAAQAIVIKDDGSFYYIKDKFAVS